MKEEEEEKKTKLGVSSTLLDTINRQDSMIVFLIKKAKG
jgi:hypothetical protein